MLVSAKEMLDKAKAGHYAVGQFNINNLEWTKSVLLTAEELRSPVILGVSEGAGKYMTGFGTVAAMVKAMHDELGITVPVALHLDHGTYEGCYKCIKAGFTSIMFDGSHYPIDENVEKTKELVSVAHAMGMSIEAEVGSIGGEEDGVDNSDVDESRLYTQPSDVLYVYDQLSPVSPNFTVAAAFGNVHGVYKPGNVKLKPSILGASQEFVAKERNLPAKPINFVFHGGSGSSREEIREAISYGAIKMNIDTDTQWAAWNGILNFYKANEAYLQGQLGNPEGPDAPNKKYYDPRVWLRKMEESMSKRLEQSFEDLNCVDVL